MRKILIAVVSLAALAAFPQIATAQGTTAVGIGTGAATGAVVGGPVGAVVGGVVGGAVGASAEPRRYRAYPRYRTGAYGHRRVYRSHRRIAYHAPRRHRAYYRY
jgi:hypothetical protein